MLTTIIIRTACPVCRQSFVKTVLPNGLVSVRVGATSVCPARPVSNAIASP